MSVGKISYENNNFHEKRLNFFPDFSGLFFEPNLSRCSFWWKTRLFWRITFFEINYRFHYWILTVLQSDPRDIRKEYLRFGHFLILETLWMISVKVVIICSCVCSRPRALFQLYYLCFSSERSGPVPRSLYLSFVQMAKLKLFEMYSNRC